MSLRFHEIAEAYHRILNPFTEDQMLLMGELCRFSPDDTLLDLACGKGEMVCRWSQSHGIKAVGVDISAVFLAAAEKRAVELGVEKKIEFVKGDAGVYPETPHEFDVVSCIGATWIGNGLLGTLEVMEKSLKPEGQLVVGEPFWIEDPPEDAYEAMGIKQEDFVSLEGTLDRFESAGYNLVEMVLANLDGWDRYEAPQWMAVHDFLEANPNDPDATALREWISNNRRAYLRHGRRYLGWGVFLLRPEKSNY